VRVIPLKDYNPTRRFPAITLLLIAVNIFVFFFVQRPTDPRQNQLRFNYEYATIPCEITQGRPLTDVEIVRTLDDGDTEACQAAGPGAAVGFPGKPIYLSILFSMFLHGGYLHLAGNMLFLWIFGNNVEDRMGHLGYLGFYLLSGVVGSATHILVQPDSTIPMVGASGAIAGVMGAYLVLFPNAPILSLIFVFIRTIPAKWLLGFWFISQFFVNPAAGVAWVAHVGGFLFGVAVALLLRPRLRPEPAPIPLY
jgi:membrane associated rhomboid family serine protease